MMANKQVSNTADNQMNRAGIIAMHFKVMKDRLFNCEVIALVIAGYWILHGVVLFVGALAPLPADQVPQVWVHHGFLSLTVGLFSAGIFWLVRHFLNKISQNPS
jgi:hypothetical protein